MTDRDELIEQIGDHVTQLTEPRRHTEPYFEWTKARHRKLKRHVTDQGSLLGQLRDGGAAAADDGAGSCGFESRPPHEQNAFDCFAHVRAIEAGSAHWVSVRLHRDLRETVEENLRLLVGASTRLEDAEVKNLADDIGRWHSAAETLTGWQSPPFTPRAACPLCTRMGTLRINPEKKRGICVECRATWSADDGSIGLLADHIRATDRTETRPWEKRCEHSWRLTVVSPLGISARCVACHGMEIRRVWPRGTPAWTELDEAMQGASA